MFYFLQTLRSNNAMAQAMKGVTKVLITSKKSNTAFGQCI